MGWSDSNAKSAGVIAIASGDAEACPPLYKHQQTSLRVRSVAEQGLDFCLLQELRQRFTFPRRFCKARPVFRVYPAGFSCPSNHD